MTLLHLALAWALFCMLVEVVVVIIDSLIFRVLYLYTFEAQQNLHLTRFIVLITYYVLQQPQKVVVPQTTIPLKSYPYFNSVD